MSMRDAHAARTIECSTTRVGCCWSDVDARCSCSTHDRMQYHTRWLLLERCRCAMLMQHARSNAVPHALAAAGAMSMRDAHAARTIECSTPRVGCCWSDVDARCSCSTHDRMQYPPRWLLLERCRCA